MVDAQERLERPHERVEVAQVIGQQEQAPLARHPRQVGPQLGRVLGDATIAEGHQSLAAQAWAVARQPLRFGGERVGQRQLFTPLADAVPVERLHQGHGIAEDGDQPWLRIAVRLFQPRHHGVTPVQVSRRRLTEHRRIAGAAEVGVAIPRGATCVLVVIAEETGLLRGRHADLTMLVQDVVERGGAGLGGTDDQKIGQSTARHHLACDGSHLRGSRPMRTSGRPSFFAHLRRNQKGPS